MKISTILSILVLTIGVPLFGQEPEQMSEEVIQRLREELRDEIKEASAKYDGLVEYAKGGWTMFSPKESLIFLYNKNTGVVYKWWLKSLDGGGVDYGFDQVQMTHRSKNTTPRPH